MKKNFASIRFNFSLSLLLALASIGLVACGGAHGPSADQIRESMEEYRTQASEAGYQPLHRSEPMPEQRDVWHEGHASIDISFIAPDSGTAHPLVLYLPGLGENVDAGGQWREAWARAGYAVLCIQPLNESKALSYLSENEDRDPRWIGHRHFSEASLERRQAAIQSALEGLKKRTQTPGSIYAKVDLDHVVVAGYDLGAQTTAALAGEKLRTPIPVLKSFNITAVLIFSPHVDLAAGNLAGRFKSIGLPFMAITGTEDSDPYGMSSPSLRRELWKRSTGQNQYLLFLEGGTHPMLSGNTLESMFKEPDPDKKEGHGKRLFGFDNARGQAWRGQDGGLDDLAGKEPESRRVTPEKMARQLIAVQEITTAFLDEQAYKSEKARSWLSQSANGYLGRLGNLQGR